METISIFFGEGGLPSVEEVLLQVKWLFSISLSAQFMSGIVINAIQSHTGFYQSDLRILSLSTLLAPSPSALLAYFNLSTCGQGGLFLFPLISIFPVVSICPMLLLFPSTPPTHADVNHFLYH